MTGGPRPVRRRAGSHLTVRVPSETAFLALLADVARGFALASGFPAAVADQIALAVDEAASNVIEHAYGGERGHVVEVRFREGADDLRIELHDTGATVDPRRLPRVDLTRYASERRNGGLGVHLMGRIMDSVTFRRLARRNVCSMTKRKPGPA